MKTAREIAEQLAADDVIFMTDVDRVATVIFRALRERAAWMRDQIVPLLQRPVVALADDEMPACPQCADEDDGVLCEGCSEIFAVVAGQIAELPLDPTR